MSCPSCPPGSRTCLACYHPVPLGGLPWRVGTKVGRTIYDAEDRLIGVMDTVKLAELVVEWVNKSKAP